VDEVLQSLIRYQELISELRDRKSALEKLPAQIQEIDDELSSASTSVEKARGGVEESRQRRRQLEGDLQDLEGKLKKYNEQLMQVRTNDEYKAMQHEIAGVKEKVGAVEEKILVLMEEVEAGEQKVREEKARLEDRGKEAAVRKNLVRQEQAELDAQVKKLESEVEATRTTIDPGVLDTFSRIADSRDGVGLAQAREERCQACFVRLRPHVYQQVKRNDVIIHCDSCKRILYYVPEAPPPDTSL